MKNEDNARLTKACQGRQDARNGFANCVNGFLIEFPTDNRAKRRKCTAWPVCLKFTTAFN